LNKLKRCKRRHKLEPPNLIFRIVKGKEVRECRTCANASARRRRKEQKKEKAD
jgi:hypothetical protein